MLLAIAARTPEASSDARPRAVAPPGVVTARRTWRVSCGSVERSLAEPASVAMASSHRAAPWRDGVEGASTLTVEAVRDAYPEVYESLLQRASAFAAEGE